MIFPFLNANEFAVDLRRRIYGEDQAQTGRRN